MSAAPRASTPRAFDLVVGEAAAAGTLEDAAGGLRPAGYEVALDAKQQALVDRFLAAIAAGGASPPTEDLPHPDLLAYLAARGLVEDTGAGVVFDAAVYRDLVARVRAHIEANGSVSLAEVRDLFGTSRKYAQALLEHLDATHVTRRQGDVRVLRAGTEAAR